MKNKKVYKAPRIQEYEIDGDISLVMMTYTDPDNPPGGGDTPPGAAQQSNSFEENPFDENNLQ
ncbi:MAG: hypothetical protein MI866_05010 [Bacteroidales bacterium]|nr:hypothetical protein [Bacteroidales bacterium]